MEIFEHAKMAAAWWAHYFVCLAGFLVRPTEEDVRRALSLAEFRDLANVQEHCAQHLGVRQGRVSGLLLAERLYDLARNGEVEIIEVTVTTRKGVWRGHMYKLTGNRQRPGGRIMKQPVWDYAYPMIGILLRTLAEEFFYCVANSRLFGEQGYACQIKKEIG